MIPTNDQWRYEKYAESLADTLLRDPETYRNRELLQGLILHILGRVYETAQEASLQTVREAIDAGFRIGVSSAAPVIPFSDLSYVPAVNEAAVVKHAQGKTN